MKRRRQHAGAFHNGAVLNETGLRLRDTEDTFAAATADDGASRKYPLATGSGDPQDAVSDAPPPPRCEKVARKPQTLSA